MSSLQLPQKCQSYIKPDHWMCTMASLRALKVHLSSAYTIFQSSFQWKPRQNSHGRGLFKCTRLLVKCKVSTAAFRFNHSQRAFANYLSLRNSPVVLFPLMYTLSIALFHLCRTCSFLPLTSQTGI